MTTVPAYSRNCASWPPDISPASTARAPSHSTKVIDAQTVTVPMAVSIATMRLRRVAVSKLASTAASNRRLCNSSSVNACTVCIAFSVSPAIALESAMRSWDARDSPRTRRPTANSGSMTIGIRITVTPISRALVRPISASPPTRFSNERSMIDRPTPAIGLHQRGVRGEPRQHLAGAGDLEEGHVHLHDAPVHGRAHVSDHPLAEPGDEIEPQRREDAEHDGHAEEADEVQIDRVAIGTADDDVIDQLPDGEGDDERGRRCNQQGRKGDRHRR